LACSARRSRDLFDLGAQPVLEATTPVEGLVLV